MVAASRIYPLQRQLGNLRWRVQQLTDFARRKYYPSVVLPTWSRLFCTPVPGTERENVTWTLLAENSREVPLRLRVKVGPLAGGDSSSHRPYQALCGEGLFLKTTGSRACRATCR